MNNQMNTAVRKIHNLLSSGAVTVTGPNQARILKQKVGATTVTPTNSLQQVGANANRCYVCDDALGASQAQHPLTEMQTSHTATKFPNKIGQLVGDAFMVIVSVEDVVCSRCTNLINYLDRLENDVERVRTNLMNLLHKKYGLNDEGGGGGSAASPPIKMQKLNSGTATRTAEDVGGDMNRARKLLHTPSGGDSPLGKQSPPVSAVQQIKISTQPLVQQQSAGTQTLQRKTTKIYKCLTCDYKTSDMRLFNTHYETCKQQNFQCKNCKKIFPNFGAMKQHMVREHNTPMDNTCAVCHINFVNETALRKHMEMNHSTNVIVTSTTTLPAGGAVAAAPAADPIVGSVTSTPLYTCNHCQFKSTDKALFDEHLRKHLSGVKPKPFKCRLCSQRFETREAATVHAKQHQPNYFKCGTCSMSFPKRELLVKHFEVHQQPATPPAQQNVTTAAAAQSSQKQLQQAPAQNLLTTQKLLQDTIDEALSDNVATTTSTAEVGSAAANNIRFFSCHICSLTFIQENYYNQHMETHRREKKSGNVNVAVTASSAAHTNNSSSMTSHKAQTTIHSDGHSVAKGSNNDGSTTNVQQSKSNTVNTATISEADIESIFEKMHSDKGDSGSGGSETVATSAANTATTNTSSAASGGQSGDNLVITSQEGTGGGITFNITIPQQDAEQSSEASATTPTTTAPVSVSIDMPMLDQPDDHASSSPNTGNTTDDKSGGKTGAEANDNAALKTQSAGPVSMPSLDDDNDAQEQSHSKAASDGKIDHDKSEEGTHAGANDDDKADGQHKANDEEHEEHEEIAGEGGEAGEELSGGGDQQVAMELDEAMQAQVESGQIKFILNENGQLLQLDNHIITDADGNQILVQDPEQIQQLLQSVGVLQSGDGLDGETLQMMTDANGQMVLVQGENNETQLIDASLLNADGQLVIQQGQDGELGEGAHVIGEDGTRIPVSVSYTADGQPIVQVQQQVMEGGHEGDAQHELDKDTAAEDEAPQHATDGSEGGADGGGGFFALEQLMQHSSEAKAAE